MKRDRPLSLARVLSLSVRFASILFWVAVSLARYVLRRVAAGRLSPSERDRLRGDVLALSFERLGATFVKFGQILSTRPDLLGPPYVEALSRLQDRVPPHPFADVRHVIDEELTELGGARIAAIDPIPVAAASVAQVHFGRLDSGEEVAIKVQRPTAKAQIERDLVLLSLGARLLDLLPFVAPLSLPGAVERFSVAMHGQLDFLAEARNNRRFAAIFASHERIAVPALIPDSVHPPRARHGAD